LAIRTSGTLPTGDGAVEGSVVYDTTTKRPKVHNGTAWVPVARVVGGGGTSFEEHVASTSAHAADNITYAGSESWADGTSPGLGNVEDTITEMVVGLAGSDGAGKIGTDPSGGLVGLNVQEQLNELDGNKADSDALASSAGTLMVSGPAKTGMTHFNLAAGTVREQVEQLLTHVNSNRPDVIGVTALPFEAGWSGTLTYAKDNCGWGHVLGTALNGTGVASDPFVYLGYIPIGCRPTKRVLTQGVELNNLGVVTGNYCVIAVNTDGSVEIAFGSITNGYYISMDFPVYKCA
jgi:hypothetical protein